MTPQLLSVFAFCRSITALKIQLDEDRRKLEDLTTKNVGLTGDIGELLQKIRTLEANVSFKFYQEFYYLL